MSRRRPGPGISGGGSTGSIAILLLMVAACLVNLVIAAGHTRNLDGPTAAGLERRYGEIGRLLAGADRVAYVSDRTDAFVGARYALAPTVLDIRYVGYSLEDDAIGGFDVAAMVADAAASGRMRILAEFRSRDRAAAFVDDLTAAAIGRGLRVTVIGRHDELTLLSVEE